MPEHPHKDGYILVCRRFRSPVLLRVARYLPGNGRLPGLLVHVYKVPRSKGFVYKWYREDERRRLYNLEADRREKGGRLVWLPLFFVMEARYRVFGFSGRSEAIKEANGRARSDRYWY